MSCMNYSILDLDWGTNSREMDTNSFLGVAGVGMATRLSGISQGAASQQTTDSSDKHNQRLRHRATTTTTIASM